MDTKTLIHFDTSSYFRFASYNDRGGVYVIVKFTIKIGEKVLGTENRFTMSGVAIMSVVTNEVSFIRADTKVTPVQPSEVSQETKMQLIPYLA